MSWNNLINQQRVRDVLNRDVAQRRIAHAYLFYGPDGVGKRAAGLAFARLLQCREPKYRDQSVTSCGVCDACRKVGRMVHPDVHLFFPFPGDATPEDIGERIRQFGEDPYVPVDYVRRPSLADPTRVSNKQAIFTVSRINQELRRAMSFKPVEGRFKIAIFTDVDAMRVEAANAFLKLLEEPTPATVFVLITKRPDRVLPTILSRCHRVRFDTLSVAHIEKALMERMQLGEERAAMLARMANGSYTRAIELAENDELMESRQLVLDYFRYAFTKHTDKLSDIIEHMAILGRERLKGLMHLMLSWIRDLMAYRTLGNDELLINIDQMDSIRRFCDNVPDAHLEAMVHLVEQAVELLSRNVQINLVLITLADKLHRAMNGEDDRRLYVPLHETDMATS